MAVYPAAAVFLLIWLWQSMKDADRGALVMIAVMPCGMFAAISVGSQSVLIFYLLGILTLGIYALRRMGGGLDRIRIPSAGVYLLFFALYALFSAIVLVRIFAGEFLVFPLSFDRAGLRLSNAYSSSLKPLAPSNSNIGQSGYIFLSALLFVILADICRRRGALFLEKGLVWAAGLNIVLGAIDLLGGDPLLSFVRTADYALLNEHSILGLPRVIGGFAEASSFSKPTAAFYGYFAMSYIIGRRGRDGILALLSLLFGILSFSSTGFVALGIATFLLVVGSGGVLAQGLPRSFGHFLVIGLAGITLMFFIATVLTPILDSIGVMMDRLFVDKLDSRSGLERRAWAEWGIKTFFETWGLGAGVGSIRGNGLAAVLLGSVGLPGALLFIAFIWSAIGPTMLRSGNEAQRVFLSARVATLTFLAGSLLSTTAPNPGLTLISVAALAAATRHRSESGTMTPRPKSVSTAS